MEEDAAFEQQLARRIAAYARRERALVEHRLEIDAELAEVRRRRRSAEALYEAEFGAPAEAAAEPARDEARAAPEQPPAGPLTGLSWGAAIVRVLDEFGPAHIREIWRLLEEGGFRTDARDPLRSIVAIALRLEPHVFRVAPNTYALANGRPADRAEVHGQSGGGGA